MKLIVDNDMKPLDAKYGRNKETDAKEEGNMILMDESEDEYFVSFQQEMKAVEMEEVTYLESAMADFTTTIQIWIENVGGARKKEHYSYAAFLKSSTWSKFKAGLSSIPPTKGEAEQHSLSMHFCFRTFNGACTKGAPLEEEDEFELDQILEKHGEI
ncbi:hypothetical protein AVEN_88832-1 [Araneus ventricosus]|uniref:Uncharacterized protein n=1 Tax=Araneus ventricosus TaxID=182803 RepID=A0A4Y2HT89_ARAVE|nr:hypothetical protein AVEN_88832-1 [Araneus ventricosus]